MYHSPLPQKKKKKKVPLSTGFSRQEYWSRLSCPSPGDLTDPGMESASLTFPALADKFFTTSATREALKSAYKKKKINVCFAASCPKIFLDIKRVVKCSQEIDETWQHSSWLKLYEISNWTKLNQFLSSLFLWREDHHFLPWKVYITSIAFLLGCEIYK